MKEQRTGQKEVLKLWASANPKYDEIYNLPMNDYLVNPKPKKYEEGHMQAHYNQATTNKNLRTTSKMARKEHITW